MNSSPHTGKLFLFNPFSSQFFLPSRVLRWACNAELGTPPAFPLQWITVSQAQQRMLTPLPDCLAKMLCLEAESSSPPGEMWKPFWRDDEEQCLGSVARCHRVLSQPSQSYLQEHVVKKPHKLSVCSSWWISLALAQMQVFLWGSGPFSFLSWICNQSHWRGRVKWWVMETNLVLPASALCWLGMGVWGHGDYRDSESHNFNVPYGCLYLHVLIWCR